MKLFAWIILMISMFIGGCIRETDLGYQEKVYFEKEGGSQKIDGKTWVCPSIEIGSETEGAYFEDDDSICVQYEWLHVTALKPENQLIITAAPNTGEKRKLKIVGSSMNEYCEIMVYQN